MAPQHVSLTNKALGSRRKAFLEQMWAVTLIHILQTLKMDSPARSSEQKTLNRCGLCLESLQNMNQSSGFPIGDGQSQLQHSQYRS